MKLHIPYKIVLRSLFLSVLAIGTTQAQSKDNYPNRPIKIVVPFSPGGATDIIARVIGQKVSEQVGQPVVIENKAGANGNIAADMVAKAAPDGYTILYNTSSIALSPALYKNLSYNVLTDFAPVILTSVVPLLLTVNTSLPVKNIQEFVALLKSRPNAYSYGSAGSGNITHLGSFLFLQELGLSATHIPYKGSAPSVVATVGGEVAFNMEPMTVGLSFVKDNRLRALAVSTKARSTVLPDVPTFGETVLPGFHMGAWQGVMAPAKTPPHIVNFLNAQITKALQSEDVKAKLIAQGAELLGSTPEEYAAYLKSEIERWRKTIQSSGVQPG
ncbi:tripartite tricarboxylate transporter substrate binding protein [Zwartia sp.]|uniref:Bug family tripartite tricarboxylate transporter substrate binding protein n=1 Tax=Zwartia sp. TaxID=2978004 RepID=UPI0027215754|nr:tripartite tricarboxylate transporter substrate binding protein [Zwartia sp.]MDO9024509.1 tripartite tricarboxylate transporter substrate binding protein [Zwartia sp.]